MLSPADLEGRSAVVTGAARGIGNAIARRLLEHGCRLAAVDKDEEALRAAFEDDRCTVVAGDLSGDGAAVADEVLGAHGVPDLIVNNAGTETDRGFAEITEPDFDLVMGTNLRGPWFFTKRLVDALLGEERPGAILFISSLHDTHVYGKPHYSASKAGVAMLTKELAAALGPRGIRVNAISPGGIETSRPERDLSHPGLPLGRVGAADDVARMAIALLSDEYSRYVTGANVPVDGGAALRDLWKNR